MKQIYVVVVIVASIIMLSSCGPQAELMNVENAINIKSEIPFAEGNAAVFFLYPTQEDSVSRYLDSTRLSALSVAFAEKVENDRDSKSGSVAVYSLPDSDFCGLDKDRDLAYLSELHKNSNTELQIFVHDLQFFQYSVNKFRSNDSESAEYQNELYDGVTILLPYKVKMDIYNSGKDSVILSRNEIDTVYIQAIAKDYSNKNFNTIIAKNLPEISGKIGEKLASFISRQWETKTIILINYPSIADWNNAYSFAESNFDWQRAINLWMPYTKSENPRKASFAAYNIAMGCQMMGKPQLALEWVNFAEKLFNFRELQMLKKEITTAE
jgi:hypothetical protein